MVYFTAGLRLGSESVLNRWRPQYDSILEMDQSLIDNWNSVVKQRDLVVIAGDFSDYSAYKTIQILKRLNGRKQLVIGNNDTFIRDDLIRSEKVFTWIGDMLNFKDDETGRWFYVCHYPMLSWKNCDKGTLHIHGHLRGSSIGGEGKHCMEDYTSEAPLIYLKNAYNVEVDLNSFKPVSVVEVVQATSRGLCTALNEKFLYRGVHK